MHFEVRDRGPGIPPDEIGHIFERFYRADTSGNIPGTGLGMAIVKEIVELMGGLAVPLLGKDGRPYAAISIAGLKDRIVGRLGMLVPALEKISKDLEGL